MAFCGNCGAKIDGEVKFCPSCGTSMEAGATAPVTSGNQDGDNTKLMSILAYLLFFIPLLTGDHKRSTFVKYHTNQGLVLFIAIVAWSVAYGILVAIFSAIFIAVGAWGLLAAINLLLGLVWFAPLIFCILGIVNAVRGVMKPLPLIGGITILK